MLLERGSLARLVMIMDSNSAVVIDKENDTLVLHMERAGFADFVKGLLGQPQTLENIFPGAFDIGKNDIENLFYLVDQRLAQQNKAHLLQFSVKIFYADDSSVLLNSLADFKGYREIRPMQSTSANLTWTYLIQFEDRERPERQLIELSIRTGEDFEMRGYVVLGKRARRFTQGFSLSIEHTARTWAADIENLLSHQIRSWTTTEHWAKKTVYNNPGWAGIVAAVSFASLAVVGLNLAATSIETGIRQTMEKALTLSTDGKLDYLMNAVFEARMQGPEKYLIVGAAAIFFLSLLVGILTGILADNPPKSYLILTDFSSTKRAESLAKRTKGWGFFICSGATSTTAGFLSKYLFLLFVGK